MGSASLQSYLKNHSFLKITSQLGKSIQAWETGERFIHKEMVQNRKHLERSSLCSAGKLYNLIYAQLLASFPGVRTAGFGSELYSL